MAKTLVQNYVHIVFGTKNRYPWLVTPYEKELHNYLSQVCISNECDFVIVGGHLDHVHILCNLSKNISLSELVKRLKSNSSRWLKTKDRSFSNFVWQKGYASFSVGLNELTRLRKYIKNQKDHHTEKNFKIELEELLEENKIEYDEKFLWD